MLLPRRSAGAWQEQTRRIAASPRRHSARTWHAAPTTSSMVRPTNRHVAGDLLHQHALAVNRMQHLQPQRTNQLCVKRQLRLAPCVPAFRILSIDYTLTYFVLSTHIYEWSLENNMNQISRRYRQHQIACERYRTVLKIVSPHIQNNRMNQIYRIRCITHNLKQLH